MSVISRRRRYRREYTGRRGYWRRESWGTRRVPGSGAIDVLARFGFIVRGIIYIVIGVIALMLAFGAAKHAADRAGALEAIASKPFGFLLLWIITIGFAGLAIWRFVQAATARLDPTEGRRLKAAGCAIAYTIAFITTLMFVRHGRAPASSDTTSRDLTAMVMSHDGGRVLVAIAGLIIAAAGIYMVLRALRLDFTRHLRMGWMGRRDREIVVRLGRAGYAARGVIMVLIGAAVVDAAVTYSPGRAEGVDGALRSLAANPLGDVLLIAVALGLIAFGLLSFFEARWRRTYGGVPV